MSETILYFLQKGDLISEFSECCKRHYFLGTHVPRIVFGADSVSNYFLLSGRGVAQSSFDEMTIDLIGQSL